MTGGDDSSSSSSSFSGGREDSAAEIRHVVDQLSAYLDGDMKAQATALVRAHLDGCAACTRAADELRAIIAGARSLERPEPPPTLWPAIEGALAEREAPLLDWRRIFVRGFAVGGLAGAAVMILLVVGLGPLRNVWWPKSQQSNSAAPVAIESAPAAAVDPLLQEAENELETAAASYEHSIGKLRSLLARLEEPRWSPDARSRFRERLARIDDAIERSRMAARSTPGDSAGNEILFAAYRSKIDFLAEAVHRGGPEELFHGGAP